ncbi:MAG: peptide chain release factor N(5)-glutamine methyltransferase, partial [Bacteroidota bacterium]
MKIAGNKLEHLRAYYLRELNAMMDQSEIDAQFALVVEHYLGIPKKDLHLKLNENLNQSDLLDIYNACKAIQKQQPIQYVLGAAYFYDMPFIVNKSVLIPRPETEELVSLILKQNQNITSVLDIGTGSGCIPITIKKHRPICEVSACDISADALLTAEKNAAKYGLNIHFFNCDILSAAVSDHLENKAFDLIVSNPPYVLESEKTQIEAAVLDHEPHGALFVFDSDPILFYRRIIQLCEKHLHKAA